MTQYTDYAFYTGQYGGGLTEEQFRRVIVPVSAHIRRITFDRADRSMEEVQHAACACCDLSVRRPGSKGRTPGQGGRIRKHRRLFCIVCAGTGRQNRPGIIAAKIISRWPYVVTVHPPLKRFFVPFKSSCISLASNPFGYPL